MNPLAFFLQDDQNRLIVRSITGTDDPGVIRGWWDDWCLRHLGSELASVETVIASVGVASEWRLSDGRRVFFKQLRPGPGERERLEAVNTVLWRLGAAGFPSPEPLAGPATCGPGLALAQSWEDAGDFNDGHDPVHRRAQAAALAELHRITDGWTDLAALGTKTLPADSLWGTPHSPLFDFDRPGAAWIDAAGRRARAALESRVPRMVVTHHDWSSQHLKWDLGISGRTIPQERGLVSPSTSRSGGPQLVTLYDTDSFVNADEALSVGFAAATFPARWDPGHDPWPTPDETEAFVDEYATARGPSFTDADRAAALAYAGFSTGYLDKCLHSSATLAGPTIVLREYRDDDIGWIRSGEAEGIFFVIADPGTGDYLGGIDLTSVDRRAGTAVLSLVIGRSEHRGQGRGTEAVRLLTRYGFEVVRLREIMLRVDPANAAAVRCYERAGFRTTGSVESGLALYRLTHP